MPQGPLFKPHTLTDADKHQLDADGHLALPGLLTDEAQKRLIGALSHIQDISETQDLLPEPKRYAAEYDDHLASLIGHPQMLDLVRWMLGPEIRFDHCVTLNRRSGNDGLRWHSHSYGEENPTLSFVRIFFYVNGFTVNDAGLKVIPGSHLFRDSDIKAATDEELLKGWMAGKVHPLTSKPLEIEPIEVPPGTVILMWTHAAHGVTARKPDSDTRWTVVYAYRNPGEPSAARWISEDFEQTDTPGTEGLMSLY